MVWVQAGFILGMELSHCDFLDGLLKRGMFPSEARRN